jgi:phenylacetate-CoA ligase
VRDIEGVDQFKIIQEELDEVRVLLKVHEGLFPEGGHQRIVDGFRKRMGDSVKVSVERVNDIERDASGKYRYVVSKVAGRL